MLGSNGNTCRRAGSVRPRLPLDQATAGPAVTVSTPITGAGQFPVVARHGRNVAVVFRGSGGHVDPHGRLDMIRSVDDGRTWSARRPIIDGPLDDRNPALGYNTEGDLLLAYSEVDSYDTLGAFVAGPGSRYSSVLTRSTDHGVSWSPPIVLDVTPFEWSSPYGKIVNTGRELILPMYGGWHPIFDQSAKAQEARGFFAFILRSRDGGRTWSTPDIIGQFYAEPALLALPGGDLLAALRRLPEDDLVIARWRARTASWERGVRGHATGRNSRRFRRAPGWRNSAVLRRADRVPSWYPRAPFIRRRSQLVGAYHGCGIPRFRYRISQRGDRE
jgi:hypothetical protein